MEKTISIQPTKLPLKILCQDYFLNYASYVILYRAVPAIQDGLKPVQRRILHSMKNLEDGRYNKVASIIGQTMQYHPHGEASINEALINIGQKGLLIDKQGNWGDSRTGDSAAAARYIEARLTPLAQEVLYNPNTTPWKPSYDGRKQEPIYLPVKFPLLLAQGTEGIAVGLATKILPHNPAELLQAAIDILKGKKIHLLPDFPNGGTADCNAYQQGKKGSKVRVRSTIVVQDEKTLLIKKLPYGVTTTSLIASILKAHEKGKIKIKKIIDNTSAEVQIKVILPLGVAPHTLVDALYVFTDCEVTLSANACVILDNKPIFLSVDQLLAHSTHHTKDLLQQELKITYKTLQEQKFYTSLESIFIKNKIYKHLEKCTTWKQILTILKQNLAPYSKKLYRPITQKDFIHLTNIKIRRISKYDSQQTQKTLKTLEKKITSTTHHLNHLVAYTISYYKKLLEKYGAKWTRKTKLTRFKTISLQQVAPANENLYVNRKQGFLGYSLKNEEKIAPCTKVDKVILFRKNGQCTITPIAEKTFVGTDILHLAIFRKKDTRRVYNMIYVDGKTGITRAKRFVIQGITCNKKYELATPHPNTRILYFTDNADGQTQIVTIILSPLSKAHKKTLDFDFSTLAVKGRTAQGNIITKYAVKKIKFKKQGPTTWGSLDLWYEATTGYLNNQKQGNFIGTFKADDQLLLIDRQGYYTCLPYTSNHRYDPLQVAYLTKVKATQIIIALYYEGTSKQFFIKRFKLPTTIQNKKTIFLPKTPKTRLYLATTTLNAKLKITYKKPSLLDIYNTDNIAIKGHKAKGTSLGKEPIVQVELV